MILATSDDYEYQSWDKVYHVETVEIEGEFK